MANCMNPLPPQVAPFFIWEVVRGYLCFPSVDSNNPVTFLKALRYATIVRQQLCSFKPQKWPKSKWQKLLLWRWGNFRMCNIVVEYADVSRCWFGYIDTQRRAEAIKMLLKIFSKYFTYTVRFNTKIGTEGGKWGWLESTLYKLSGNIVFYSITCFD